MRVRKIPVEVDAFMCSWLLKQNRKGPKFLPLYVYDLLKKGKLEFDVDRVHVHTLEGVVTANKRAWLVIGVEGEPYPVKSSVFKKTYELVK